jgi:branched-chain amino acid transport system ATP-binding protein
MNALALHGVSLAFGGVRALDGLDLTVPRATVHGVIGPNGAGKTTLLNAICGVTPPDAGSILLNDVPITGIKSARLAQMGLARTFQTSRMFGSMTVLENVMTGLHTKLRAEPFTAAFSLPRVREEERAAAARARRVLDFVDMRRFEEAEATNLSFGQQRLIEIARALVAEPTVLLLDEPAVGLSAPRVAELDRLLRRIRDERGVTIVMVEHVIQLVMGVCDRVSVLSSGCKIAEGSAREIRDDPRVQEAYFGRALHAQG